jgi:hypothetical protein
MEEKDQKEDPIKRAIELFFNNKQQKDKNEIKKLLKESTYLKEVSLNLVFNEKK